MIRDIGQYQRRNGLLYPAVSDSTPQYEISMKISGILYWVFLEQSSVAKGLGSHSLLAPDLLD